MPFDLTKNVQLDPVWQKRYRISRWFLWLVFIFAVIHLSLLIFFPSQNFFYSSTGQPSQGYPLANIASSSSQLSFDAFSNGSFSEANVELILDSGDTNISGTEIKARKSYQAFAYPTADRPVGFPSGSLLKNNGNYYIISQDKMRRFASARVIEALGYTDNSFLEADTDELSYSDKESDITDDKNYADDSLFVVGNTYYRLENQTLYPFISQGAFQSFFEPQQAVSKNEDFLNHYPVSPEAIGYSSGSLLSFDTSAFVVDGKKVVPFSNPETFLSFGYDWSDIIPVTEEEIGLYERSKIITIDQPHPDGTIFADPQSSKYFLIKEKMKLPIVGNDILKTYSKKKPILIGEKSLEFNSSCKLERFSRQLFSYRCAMPVENLNTFPGSDYHFTAALSENVRLQNINVFFSRNINLINLKDTLYRITLRILSNYGYASLK